MRIAQALNEKGFSMKKLSVSCWFSHKDFVSLKKVLFVFVTAAVMLAVSGCGR